MDHALELLDGGEPVSFRFADMMRYHGPGSPGGVAHAFKVLERALPVLGAGELCERRQITVRTAFAGPGARDGFELVTRAVGDGRYAVDATLARPDLGLARENFVFSLQCGQHSLTLLVREGFVTEELLALARAQTRSADEEARLTRLKREMADRVMSAPADDVYDVGAPA